MEKRFLPIDLKLKAAYINPLDREMREILVHSCDITRKPLIISNSFPIH